MVRRASRGRQRFDAQVNICPAKRFNELHRALGGVTHRTLTQQLRELGAHRVVHRKVYRQVPPKVEYSLTPLGESLRPVLDVMHQWGERYPHGLSVVQGPARYPVNL